MSENTVVEPTITKSDARDLKALVKNDVRILHEQLKKREQDLGSQLRAEWERRDQEATAQAEAELKNLQKRVTNLNKAIVEKVEELSKAGWKHSYGRGDRRKAIDPTHFTVSIPVENLMPPSVDFSDLQAASEALTQAYWNTRHDLDRQEGEMIRELTLRSITTTAARDFILEMPTAESLLPTPTILQIEA